MTQSEKSKLSRDFLQKEQIHSQWLSDYLNPDIDHFYDLAFDYILSTIGAGPRTRILDAGCGYCHHTIRLARSGADIVGVDFSDAALSAGSITLANAGISDRVKLVKGDLTKLDFESNQFDVVISWGVLMHIPHLEAALAELARVLKPGGHMVLCENNVDSLDVKFREGAIRGIKAMIGRAKNTTSTRTERGLEVWQGTDDGGLMVRKTDMNFLSKFLADHGVNLVERRAGQFSEAYVNLPSRALKKIVYRMNEAYFRLRWGPRLALGNILILKKAAA